MKEYFDRELWNEGTIEMLGLNEYSVLTAHNRAIIFLKKQYEKRIEERMNFDKSEDAVLRYIKCEKGKLRIRFSDGVLFAWSLPIEEGVTPLDMTKVFSVLADDIKQRYQEEK